MGNYKFQPKNNVINRLRSVFDEHEKLPEEQAEKKYREQFIDVPIIESHEDKDIEYLLKYHWRHYDYQVWTRGMEKIISLLDLKNAESIYEAGFGAGAPMAYIKHKFEHIGVAGNDFFMPFVDIAKQSQYIGDGAFLHAASQNLGFIESKFDAVMSLGAIGYDNKEETLKIFENLVNLCKKGGYILLGSLDNEDDFTEGLPRGSAFQTGFVKSELHDIFKQLPVEIISIDNDKAVTGMENHRADTRFSVYLKRI